MKTIIIQARINKEGEEVLTTNNKELKSYLQNLKDIIEKKTVSKYVKLKAYKSKFNNRSYEFEFYKEDTIEKALRREFLENYIKEDIESILRYEDKKDLERFIKEMYDTDKHYIINEILEDLEKVA
jgi:hypothetical protein